MSSKAVLASGLVTAMLVLLVVGVFEVSLERAAVLAPVIVVAFGAAAGVIVLWAKVGWEALQRRRRPWLVVGIAAAVVVLIAALSLLGFDERQPLPVTDEVAAELAPGLLDHAVRGQLDEVLGLLVVQLVVVHEAEPERGRADALREVGRVEAEAEAQELDDDVVTGRVVVRSVHGRRISTPLDWPA